MIPLIIIFLIFLLCVPSIIKYLRGSIRLYKGKEVVEEMEDYVREYKLRKIKEK